MVIANGPLTNEDLHRLIATIQDYRDRTALQAAIVAHGRKQVRVSPRNAVEERNVLSRLDEARNPLVPGAMLSCDRRRVIDRAGVANLGRTRVALQQKGFRSHTGSGGQYRGEYPKKDEPRRGAGRDAQSEAASTSDWIS